MGEKRNTFKQQNGNIVKLESINLSKLDEEDIQPLNLIEEYEDEDDKYYLKGYDLRKQKSKILK